MNFIVYGFFSDAIDVDLPLILIVASSFVSIFPLFIIVTLQFNTWSLFAGLAEFSVWIETKGKTVTWKLFFSFTFISDCNWPYNFIGEMSVLFVFGGIYLIYLYALGIFTSIKFFHLNFLVLLS